MREEEFNRKCCQEQETFSKKYLERVETFTHMGLGGYSWKKEEHI